MIHSLMKMSPRKVQGESTKTTIVTGVDIIVNQHLQETSFTKVAYKKYNKDSMESVKVKLEEKTPDKVFHGRDYRTNQAHPH